VVIDDEQILYPKVAVPDIYVIMSQEGFEKYGASAQESAIMLIDSTLVHSRPKCKYIEIPATGEAKATLKVIVANIVMLGALIAATKVVSEESLKSAILDSVPKGTEDLNLKAMQLGLELGKQP
ncbi:MAG: 2-oxoacid:ferredoxin oxidoreductase subunit gamma, partial [Methanomicrobiales archaeon]|nr:2-oxoacid:ferredoxin oxidoreductase subunit gamma [Methanomicrobiales archaeon]